MTHIIDLQCLWKDHSSAEGAAKGGRAFDSRQNIVSVILVTHPQHPKFIQVFQSVLAQPYIREIIIVDVEASSQLEEALQPLIALQPKCRLIKGQPQMGLGAAYNLGAQYASCQYFLFLNSSTVLPPHLIQTLLRTGLPKPSPWVIGVKEQPPYFLKPWCHATDSECPTEVSLPGGGWHVFSITPACLFLSAQTFVALKGLDPHCQEAFHLDLCMRVHLAGGGVYGIQGLSLNPLSPAKYSLRQLFQQEWRALSGWLVFHHKHMSRKTNIIMRAFFYGRLLGRFGMRLVTYSFISLSNIALPKAAFLKRRTVEGSMS